ncbi:MAG: serine/threonine-protein kinase [Burkholderiaceae bacterium]
MTHPEKLGKYTVTGVIGDGAMGVVYTGFDAGIQRRVALKTIHRKLIDDDKQAESMAARFRNEAQAVGRLLHPGIVAIYEYGEDETTAFIAMEYVEGRNLAQVLTKTRLLPEPELLHIMDQLLDALDCAHSHHVWHRDIKPANLIITATGQLKVADFGIARIDNRSLTQVDSIVGTPGYMAPEQYVGDAIDHRVDIFAAGVLLYRLLSGEVPFAGSYEAVMYKILNEHPTPPSQVEGSGRTARFDRVVAKAIAKDPQARFTSAAEFREVLSRVAAGLPVNLDETTVVMRPAPSAAVASAMVEAHHDKAAGTPSGAHTTPITGWDSAALTQVERALAAFIGPMARVLVRNAAKVSTDMRGLGTALAEHIAEPADRSAFLQKVATISSSLGGLARSHTTAPKSAPGGTAAAPALSEATIAHAVKVMTKHIGPIAKIVVKKASAVAGTQEQLFQLLADQSEGVDRNKLLQELQQRH